MCKICIHIHNLICILRKQLLIAENAFMTITTNNKRPLLIETKFFVAIIRYVVMYNKCQKKLINGYCLNFNLYNKTEFNNINTYFLKLI